MLPLSAEIYGRDIGDVARISVGIIAFSVFEYAGEGCWDSWGIGWGGIMR